MGCSQRAEAVVGGLAADIIGGIAQGGVTGDLGQLDAGSSSPDRQSVHSF